MFERLFSMKRFVFFISILTVISLLVFSSCAKDEEKGKYDNSTVYAQVTEINGTEITFTIGELKEVSMDFGQGGMEMPSGEVPPMPNGDMEMPSGEIPPMPSGEIPPMPDGGMMELPSGEVPPMPNGDMVELPFIAGDEIIVLNLNQETVSILKVGDITEIVFAQNGAVKSITKVSFDSFAK